MFEHRLQARVPADDKVMATTRLVVSSAILGRRAGRVVSRSKPSMGCIHQAHGSPASGYRPSLANGGLRSVQQELGFKYLQELQNATSEFFIYRGLHSALPPLRALTHEANASS